MARMAMDFAFEQLYYEAKISCVCFRAKFAKDTVKIIQNMQQPL